MNGFDDCLVINCKGMGRERAGGITLLGKEKVKVKVMSYSLNHIRGLFFMIVFNMNGLLVEFMDSHMRVTKGKRGLLFKSFQEEVEIILFVLGTSMTCYERMKRRGNQQNPMPIS